MAKYRAIKRGIAWYVIDDRGYDVSYVNYDTKKEALDAIRVYKLEDKEQADVLAYVTEGLGDNG